MMNQLKTLLLLGLLTTGLVATGLVATGLVAIGGSLGPTGLGVAVLLAVALHGRIANWFSTHPPAEARIERWMKLAGVMPQRPSVAVQSSTGAGLRFHTLRSHSSRSA